MLLHFCFESRILFFQDFRQILEDNLELLVQLKDLIIDLVQEGFQDFFRALDDHFILLSGRQNSASLGQGFAEGTQVDKAFAGLVLVLAQLSVFIEQTAIPRITEARTHLIVLCSISLRCINYCNYSSLFVLGLVLKFHLLLVRK